MNKYLWVAAAVAILTACAEANIESYSIKGQSSVSLLDGSKLYLRVVNDGNLQAIDSCEVVHGGFAFSGSLDTTRMAMLSVREGGIPIVIEKGDITVTINNP